MVKEKGAPPVRRLPSRSGRASFEADPSTEQLGSDAPSSSRESHITAPVDSSHPAGTSASAASSEAHGDPSGGINRSASNGEGSAADPRGPEEQQPKGNSSSGSGANDASSGDNPSTPRAPSAAAAAAPALPTAVTPSPAPRIRGRPRKKPLEIKVDDLAVDATVAAASPAAQASAGAGSSEAALASGEAGTAAAAFAGRRPQEEEDGGYNSDEWSEDDEVHRLPKEVKAQFGNVSSVRVLGFVRQAFDGGVAVARRLLVGHRISLNFSLLFQNTDYNSSIKNLIKVKQHMYVYHTYTYVTKHLLHLPGIRVLLYSVHESIVRQDGGHERALSIFL